MGANAKVVNSVLLEGAVLEQGVHIQNCIICPGALLKVQP